MTITPASLRMREPQSTTGYYTTGYNTPEGATFPKPLSPTANWCWPGLEECTRENPGWSTKPKSGHERFPFNNFTYFLTLFSKCFSSFDHSTCALSVSGQYLALEDIYLPFRAAFPNYSTRRRNFTEIWHPTRRGSHPLWRPVPGRYMSSKAKYWPETDSAQVEWSKDEKHFEKRVKQYVKLLKGKRLWPDLGPVNHPAFSLVHLAGPGQHQFGVGDKGGGNVAPPGVL